MTEGAIRTAESHFKESEDAAAKELKDKRLGDWSLFRATAEFLIKGVIVKVLNKDYETLVCAEDFSS